MSIRVLIVDDAPFIREVLRGSLQSANFEVVGEAQNGTDAVRLFSELHPDLVLMDIIMPKMSGIDATKEILQIDPSAKVVACSTVDDEQMMNRAIEAGCVKYITKPFEKNVLINTLKQLVE
ncbi:MAG: response regulator [Bdellovibrionales bacterium]|nr:response regulator [Bdellovibrionales bacterium]